MISLSDGGVPVSIVHRLALAVTPLDALVRQPVTEGIHVARLPGQPVVPPAGRGLVDPLTARVGGQELVRSRSGRHVVLLRRPYRPRARLLVYDDRRRFVARRVDVPLWPEASLTDGSGLVLPAASRAIDVTLWPGPAYPLVPGTTGIRGQVRNADGTPTRWARVVADVAGLAAPGGTVVVGRAHGDERGEFLLVITATGAVPPPRSALTVQLTIHASTEPLVQPAGGDPLRLADLPTETLADPSPQGYGDEGLLRGEQVPDGFSAHAVGHLDIPVGDILSPQPFSLP